jgi:arylsulfatase A-like enzyme/sucrose-6-phosphate hydrolase SacC (GH32 family)
MNKNYLTAAALLSMTAAAQTNDKPNIVLIMADDLGYSDLGCYGGEINTPNLDQLADEGLRFTQFFNGARSCPSRASLLTGCYPHTVGITGMGQSLSTNCVTIAEALKGAGYNTGMTGKWHLSLTQGIGNQADQMAWLSHQNTFDNRPFAPLASYPSNRGFDEHYGTIWGVVNHFDPFSLVHNTEAINTVPSDFYSTDYITDKTIDLIDGYSEQDAPFFMYVAYNAPHWPLHAKPADIAKYNGVYDDGWDALRTQRYNRMTELGLINPAQTPPANNESDRLWTNETDKTWLADNMEVHAAMVDCIDRGVGRIVAKLKATGEYDNTIILFMSDNGASSENYTIGEFDRHNQTRDGQQVVHNARAPGSELTYNYIANGWAGAINTPFRYWKRESFHGGIATPLIVHWKGIPEAKKGSVNHQPGHFIDLMPTVLDLAETTYPATYNGNTIQPLPAESRSLLPLIESEGVWNGERTFFWEHENGRAVRAGDWKLTALTNQGWQLFNLAVDYSETNNVAVEYPAKVRELKTLWNGWAESVGLTVAEDAPDTDVALAFYYPFNETLSDSSANHYALTPSANGYSFGDGKYGKALSLNGDAQYLDLNTTGVVNTADTQYTVCAWIYDESDVIPASGTVENGYYFRDEILLAQKDNAGTGRIVLYTRVENPTGEGEPRFLFNNFLGGKQNPSTPGLFERGKWKHVAVLCDPVNKNVSYYVDGVRDVTVSANTFEACTGGFRIGGHKAGKDYWHGKIDELYFFKGLLSKEDILKVRNNTYFAEQQPFHTNLENFQTNAGTWTESNNGYTSSNLNGDGFALSSTAAGRNFVYEADVVFNNRNESAASLVFGSTNDLDSKNMYVANIHIHNGVTRLFKFQKTGLRGQEAIDLVGQKTVAIPADNKFHLSVTVLGNHIVYSLNGQVVANTADYTMGSVGGQNDAFIGHYLGLLSWKANCTYQNVYVTEVLSATDPRLRDLAIGTAGITGTVEHNVVFDSTQYVSITAVTNETQQVKLNYEKRNPATVVTVKIGDTVYPDGVVPLEVGNNTVTVECTNENAKVIYRVIVIRRKPADLYYNEFDRPQYHWSVKQWWSNDPNGLVYYNGEYHFFHQHYPAIDWGPMHWGHAVSTDLIHWTELPTALYPDEFGTMFSGSAVVDENNTSGLFKEPDGTPSATGGMVLIITADGNGERVTIAYSKDGRHFTKHDGVSIDWTEDPIDDRAFRDPKVFRYQNKWFLIIAGGPLRIYSSDNLIDWQVESTYTDIHTECPDLVRLPVVNGEPDEYKWLLSRGGVGYKVGDFRQESGKWTFVPDTQYNSTDGNMNMDNDAYATQTWSVGNFDVPQRVIEVSWMNFRASGIGKDNGNKIFNGQMNIQKELTLIKDVNGKYLLQQTPLKEYEVLRDSANVVSLVNQSITGNVPVDFTGQSYEIVAEFEIGSGTTEVGFRVRSGNGYYTKIGYNVANNQFYSDRSRAGIGGYRDKFTAIAPKAAIVDGKLQIRIFVDRNCVETLGADNTVFRSILVYPYSEANGLDVFATGNAVTVNAQIFPMRSIWNNTATATPDPKAYTHLIMYGQSLSTGHEAGTALSRDNAEGVYMLGQQVWFNYGNYDYTEINPLVGHPSFVMGGDLFEPAIMGAANHIRLKDLEDNIIASSTGDSGKSIEDLSKESQVQRLYGVYTQALHYGKQAADRTQSTISVPAIFWLQGEWNYTQEGSGLTSGSKPNNTKNGYKELLLTLKNNMQDDAVRIYGQTERPLFITYQTGGQYVRGRDVAIGMAQVEAANENDDIVCAGPVYQMTNYNHGHLDANGYRWYGEMLGKVYNKVKVEGENFIPLQPKAIYRDAANAKKIRIKFHVPVPPLVLDTKTMPQIAGYGFQVYYSRANQTITDVQIVGDDAVEITCANDLDPTKDVEIIYAGQDAVGQGNLRDSDPYQAVFNYVNIDAKDGSGNYIYPRSDNRSLRPAYEPKNEQGQVIYDRPYPLYNFCVGFNYRLAAGENEKEILTGINRPKAVENNISILQTGKTLRVVTPSSDTNQVRIYDVSGKLMKDFGMCRQSEYSLSSLEQGVYIVSVITGGSASLTGNRKIIL